MEMIWMTIYVKNRRLVQYSTVGQEYMEKWFRVWQKTLFPICSPNGAHCTAILTNVVSLRRFTRITQVCHTILHPKLLLVYLSSISPAFYLFPCHQTACKCAKNSSIHERYQSKDKESDQTELLRHHMLVKRTRHIDRQMLRLCTSLRRTVRPQQCATHHRKGVGNMKSKMWSTASTKTTHETLEGATQDRIIHCLFPSNTS